jgi:hypothetical protein
MQVEVKPLVKRAILPMPVVKPLSKNTPNSVFALGSALSKT